MLICLYSMQDVVTTFFAEQGQTGAGLTDDSEERAEGYANALGLHIIPPFLAL
jgi:hypothetical protein